MKALLLLFCLLTVNICEAREWKNKTELKRTTGQDDLPNGDWLRKDRKKNTDIWSDANRYNMSSNQGDVCYTSFAQKRDFYYWLDTELQNRGSDVRWPGVAYIVTRRLRYLDSRFVQKIIIRDKAFIDFVEKCNNLILTNIYLDLRALYNREEALTGSEARHWDSTLTYKEQCTIVDTVYDMQPRRIVEKLNRMAHGKGIYKLVMPRKLRINKNISDCENRCAYGLNIISRYYDAKRRKRSGRH